MTRPTPEEAEKMRIRRLIADIWERDLKLPKDKIESISINNFGHSVEITTNGKLTAFSKSLFTDYLNEKNRDKQQELADRIKTALKELAK